MITIPRKPRSPCRFSGCAELTETPYCKKHYKVMNKLYDLYQRDPESKKRYGTKWRKIRNAFVKNHPICELCERKNILIPTEEVHHVIPLSKGGSNDEENLMALCKSYHSRITATEGGRWG